MNSMPLDKTQGIYAAEIDRLLPLMPKEDAARLNDPILRENFIARVYAYADWQKNLLPALANNAKAKKTLTDFHVRYKYILMSHHIPSYNALGRLISNLKAKPLEEIANEYIIIFMKALAHTATRKQHTNVLQHLQGYLKKELTSEHKKKLGDTFKNYRKRFRLI